ncbi:MAG: hypothetical protein CJBNEKGG_01008 [Prosthecobacter sp.]|nr:hypothetical protein [Prosthecobacter sp.]
MSESDTSSFKVTAQQVLEVIDHIAITQLSLRKLAEHFGDLAKEKKHHRALTEERACRLLVAACSFLPNFEFKGNPFGPWWHNLAGPGTRSLMAEDLCDEDINALEGIVTSLQNLELRARIADVVWECRKRSHLIGRDAIQSYIQIADAIGHKGVSYLSYIQCIERAAQISGKLGLKSTEHSELIASIHARLVALSHDVGSARVCGHLIRILLQHTLAYSDPQARIAKSFAKHLEGEGLYDLAEDFWKLAERIHRLAQQKDDAWQCQLRAAECLVAIADKQSENPDLGASGWMLRAVEALRKAKAPPERIAYAHKRLLELQQQTLKTFKSIPLDIIQRSDFQEQFERCTNEVRAKVSELTFRDSLIFLATQILPTNWQEHREATLEHLKSNVWAGIVNTVQLDHSGKISESMAPKLFGELDEEFIKQKMLEGARQTTWPVIVNLWIDPVRQTIVNLHGARYHDLAFLVTNNPFVREGREGLYLRGIQAGFYGDWAVATHLLAPQIEDSIRRVLQLRGKVTSTLDSGIQQERDINQLLWADGIVEAFGPDILFDLRGILIERFGYNLRNDMAHGLLNEGDFYDVSSVYLWWLSIMLCWRGYCIANLSE